MQDNRGNSQSDHSNAKKYEIKWILMRETMKMPQKKWLQHVVSKLCVSKKDNYLEAKKPTGKACSSSECYNYRKKVHFVKMWPTKIVPTFDWVNGTTHNRILEASQKVHTARVVIKKDGQYISILKSWTQSDTYQIEDNLSQSQYITIQDLVKKYWQVPVAKNSE